MLSLLTFQGQPPQITDVCVPAAALEGQEVIPANVDLPVETSPLLRGLHTVHHLYFCLYLACAHHQKATLPLVLPFAHTFLCSLAAASWYTGVLPS